MKSVSQLLRVDGLRFNFTTHRYGSRLHDDKGLGFFMLIFFVRAAGSSASTQGTSGIHRPVAISLGRFPHTYLYIYIYIHLSLYIHIYI